MTKKKEAPAPAETAPVVYCGPDIPGVARQYTVYRNGLPAPLAEAMEKTPALRSLALPLERLPEARKAINERSGPIYRLFTLAREQREEV